MRQVGYTTEGNAVWAAENYGTYWVEGRFEGQKWLRSYSQIWKWVKFFEPIKRDEHKQLIKVEVNI